MGNSRKTSHPGHSGELEARRFVEKHLRMTILETNFRSYTGEIDIVARDGKTIVFIEVKSRKRLSAGLPEESVTPQKQQKIRKTAQGFLLKEGINPHYVICRFDVISIIYRGENPHINYIPDAF